MVPVMVAEMVGWAVAGFIGSLCADDIYDRLNKKTKDKQCSCHDGDDDIIIDADNDED